MPYTLKGRRVLVCAGSRGLGALICEKFAAEGCHVMVNYISREDRAREVVEKVRAYGVRSFLIHGVRINPALFNFPVTLFLLLPAWYTRVWIYTIAQLQSHLSIFYLGRRNPRRHRSTRA